MRICLISGEIFAWNKYGGFGRVTRWIGRELVRRGFEVFAVVPRRAGQKRVEKLDGMTVLSFPLNNPLASISMYRECQADIYHSQQPSLSTVLAMMAAPRKKHVITCQDMKDAHDWDIEINLPSRSRLAARFSRLYEDNLLIRMAARKADRVYSSTLQGGEKARMLLGLKDPLEFMPSPVEIPLHVQKSPTPTVCYVGRWDRRKRPQLTFDLAAQFPHVRFIAVGLSQDAEWEKYLRDTYQHVPNLEMRGLMNQFDGNDLNEVYARSWVLINTAQREGVPISFMEAAAHRCAILSHVNPEGFTSYAGYHAEEGGLARGLNWLLENNRWAECGERGYQYVRDNFEAGMALERHIQAYRSLLSF